MVSDEFHLLHATLWPFRGVAWGSSHSDFSPAEGAQVGQPDFSEFARRRRGWNGTRKPEHQLQPDPVHHINEQQRHCDRHN